MTGNFEGDHADPSQKLLVLSSQKCSIKEASAQAIHLCLRFRGLADTLHVFADLVRGRALCCPEVDDEIHPGQGWHAMVRIVVAYVCDFSIEYPSFIHSFVHFV